jgi:ribosomal-protein-alanine N-acetyltransferase
MKGEIIRLGVRDAAALAELHQLSFADAWREVSFAALLEQASVLALGLYADDGLLSFCLFQSSGAESELLTLATRTERRGEGLAFALLDYAINSLSGSGVTRLLLDVAEDNAAARALYARLGFTEDGRRRGYYVTGRGVPADAILMSKAI